MRRALPAGDGRSAGEHLAAAEGQGAEVEAIPEPPVELAYLLGWYRELDGARVCTGMGLSPLAWRDIEAWARLRHVTLRPWELDLLMALDATWMAVAGERNA